MDGVLAQERVREHWDRQPCDSDIGINVDRGSAEASALALRVFGLPGVALQRDARFLDRILHVRKPARPRPTTCTEPRS